MSKDEIIKNALDKYHEECSKISNDLLFPEKIKIHEDLIIKIVLETLLEET